MQHGKGGKPRGIKRSRSGNSTNEITRQLSVIEGKIDTLVAQNSTSTNNSSDAICPECAGKGWSMVGADMDAEMENQTHIKEWCDDCKGSGKQHTC